MTLQEMVQQALQGGPVSAQTGQDILSRAVMLGASAEDLSQLAASAGFQIPVDEINQFISSNSLSGGLPGIGSPEDTYQVASNQNTGSSNLAITGTGAPPTGTATTTPIGPTNPNGAPPLNPLPPGFQTLNIGQPAQTPGVTQGLPPIENLGNTFANLFGNNPGALGFSDLNPLVTGAENTTQTAIPEFLKPFLAQSVDASQGAMAGLTQLLARDNALTSPFNFLQEQAQQQALGVAGGAGGFIPQAQDAFREIADSTDIVEMFNEGRELLKNPQGFSGLQQFGATGPQMNTAAQNALEQTAGGNFLYGNPGFDAAVQASIAQAMPNINSGFALQGGAGALSGGLRDSAIAEVTANAFAREFGNERNRQLGAANALNDFGLSSGGQQLSALNSLVGAQQNAGNTIAGIANADRSRQLQAAAALPQLGLLNSQITGQVGDARQAQEERTKLGQVQAMQNLLNSSFGNINPNALFGNINSVQSSSNTGLSALGGAMAGNSLAGSLGVGGPWGAIAGGLLGAFG